MSHKQCYEKRELLNRENLAQAAEIGRLRAELEAARTSNAAGRLALVEERDSARALLAASQARVVGLEKMAQGTAGVLSRAEGNMNLVASYLSKADGMEYEIRTLQIAAGACLRARLILLEDISPAPSAAPEPKECGQCGKTDEYRKRIGQPPCPSKPVAENP